MAAGAVTGATGVTVRAGATGAAGAVWMPKAADAEAKNSIVTYILNI